MSEDKFYDAGIYGKIPEHYFLRGQEINHWFEVRGLKRWALGDIMQRDDAMKAKADLFDEFMKQVGGLIADAPKPLPENYDHIAGELGQFVREFILKGMILKMGGK